MAKAKFHHVTGVVFAGLMFAYPSYVSAQNISSTGQNWSTGWGFSTTAERAFALQQAQVLRQNQSQQTAPVQSSAPTTIVTNNSTTVNDARSNYQEFLGEILTFDTIDFQLNGDRIGQNTNSVGSMNTGTTNIEVVGENNHIIATNAAETEGCVDGSIQQDTSLFESMASPSGIDISLAPSGRTMRCSR